jgi:competence protein ComEC
MLLGGRSFVEHDRIVEFQRTGVYHLLVLAGLLVGALTAFLIWAGRRLHLGLISKTLLALFVLAAYVGIVEDRPPILRAALMEALYLLARLLYRHMELLNVAALSALGILAARPPETRDASFLFSFSAMGIIRAHALPWIAHTSEPSLRGLENLTDVSRDVSHMPRVFQFRIEMKTAASWVTARLPRPAAQYGRGLLMVPIRTGPYRWGFAVISAILQLVILLPRLTTFTA